MSTLTGEKRPAMKAQPDERYRTPWQLGLIRGWLMLMLAFSVVALFALAARDISAQEMMFRSCAMFLLQAISLTGIAVTYLHRPSAGG
jgi:hypothetical protein